MTLSSLFATAAASFRAMTVSQLITAALVVLFVLTGGVGQLLALNFWVESFPPGSNGLFTVLTLSSVMNAVVFSLILLVWVLIKKPPIRFMVERFGIIVVVGAGIAVSLNGVLIVGGTALTPEIFQALLLSTMLPWTFLFVKVLFAEKRRYFSPLVILSFVCSLGGILLGAAQGFGSSKFTFNRWMWTIVFAAGMVPGAMNAVLSAKYMRRFTDTTAEEEAHARKHARFPDGEHTTLIVGPEHHAEEKAGHPVTDATTAKLAMLAFSGIAQVFGMIVFVPTSALPWFGTEPSVGAAYQDIAVGLKCAFGGGAPICTQNFHYMIAFNVCFLLGGAAQAFLNFYSPALTSIVTQLQSPLSAVVLLIAPVLSPAGQTAPSLGYSLGAVVFLVAGCIVYTVWEEGTRRQKHDELGSPILEENVAGVRIADAAGKE